MNLFEICSISLQILSVIITGATALATLWYVRIAGKTLHEIKLQRETTYLPEIIINSTSFYIKCENEYGYPVQYNLSSDITLPSIKENFTILTIPIKVYNIGLGTAKKIQYKFEFDIKSAIAILQNKKIFLNSGIEHVFNFDYKNDSIMINGIDGMSYFSISLDDRSNSYLLPVNIEKSGIDLDLPIHISTMYAIYTFIWRLDHQLMQNCSFPPIFININYSDINNNEFNKLFEVNLLFRGGGATEIWNKLEVDDRAIYK